MTTRAERKAATRRRIVYQIEAWTEELKEHKSKGKTLQQAFDILAEDTERAAKMFPQEKSLLLDAWREFMHMLKISIKNQTEG